MKNMVYRLPTLADEKIVQEYLQEHYDNGEMSLNGASGLTRMPFDEWVEYINTNASTPTTNKGRFYTLLCFDGDELVGMMNIRFELKDAMRNAIGDIGDGVRPTRRRQGYATVMLKHALNVCKDKGMKDVILGCYKHNVASAKAIQKNGGKLLRECEINGEISQYYVIDLTD
jgi:predicted acetyltransferase